ncbi:MAG: MarR family winged helix-turn-helix transcriptional regulator [Gemmatimonas sp.]
MSARSISDALAEKPHIDDIGVLLTVALGAFKRRLHSALADAGYDDLGPSYGYVFRSLADGPLSLVDLSVRLSISAQGTLKIANEMLERGYVERRNDPTDKRVRLLLLTARGRGALSVARRFHALMEQELVKAAGAASLASARQVLLTIAGEDAAEPLTWGDDRPF